MRLGKASAYAVFATMHIAEHGSEEPVQGRVIADSYDIPIEYLLKILQRLVRARVIQSERGCRGGFRPCKAPVETTLLEIVEAVEGPLDEGLGIRSGMSGAEGARQILENACSEAARFAQSLLRKTTIEQLIDSARKAGC